MEIFQDVRLAKIITGRRDGFETRLYGVLFSADVILHSHIRPIYAGQKWILPLLRLVLARQI